MSDTEYIFDEEEVSIDRELIAVVRANRFLYDKTEKLYANGSVKTEAWTQVGASLTHPLEGPAAEKRFYTLRQRFGKERRKILQSMPRSGAGTDLPTYTPTWVLYKDLKFLGDVIKPRKTSSNYKSKAPANKAPASQMLGTSSSSSCVPSTSTSYVPSSHEITILRTISPSSSAAASSDSSNFEFTSFAGIDESSINIFESHSSSSSATPPPVASPSPVISGNNNAAQLQKAMSNIGAKRKVPPPDSFAIRKRQDADIVNKTLMEQSTELTELATKIDEAIVVPPPLPNATVVNNASSGIQSMLSAIGFALSTIPEQAEIECLIGVLQYINEFSKKKNKLSEAND